MQFSFLVLTEEYVVVIKKCHSIVIYLAFEMLLNYNYGTVICTAQGSIIMIKASRMVSDTTIKLYIVAQNEQ